jgi:hypothetical protein
MTAVQTRRSAALSALGSLGGFRRRVVRSGGVVHRPDAEPRLARFQTVESGAAPKDRIAISQQIGLELVKRKCRSQLLTGPLCRWVGSYIEVITRRRS